MQFYYINTFSKIIDINLYFSADQEYAHKKKKLLF